MRLGAPRHRRPVLAGDQPTQPVIRTSGAMTTSPDMPESPALRPHEEATDAPLPRDASLAFIGQIRTPWTTREDCPRQGDLVGPECQIELAPPWDAALDGIEAYARIEVLYWLDRSRRDLLRQNPNHGPAARGTFSLRSPIRPNPIGTSLVALVRREGPVLVVRGLDCLDGTPLLDLKPDRCAYTPVAPDALNRKPAPVRDSL